jgi:hypothetical protein
VEDPATFDFVENAFAADDLIGRGGRCEVPEAEYVYAFLRRGGS